MRSVLVVTKTMKRATIKDIAAKLGVSVSTVSRGLNNAPDVSQKTKDLIQQTAEALNYSPNPVAKRLHQKKSYQVGVVVPEFHSDFFPRIIIGMQEVLEREGYQLLIMQSGGSSENELENVKKLEENMVDGIMISLTKDSNHFAYYNKLHTQGMPMVCFNRVNKALEVPKVVFNDYKWAHFAVEHLIMQGCKNIIHLAGNKNLDLAKERERGFRKAMSKFKLKLHENSVLEAGLSVELGIEKMQAALISGQQPDGVFAVNDHVALGAMKAIKEAGLRIPEDIKVIGFSEAQWSDMIEPPLSSVRQPTRTIGVECAEMLIKQIKKQQVNSTLVLEGELVKRGSTK